MCRRCEDPLERRAYQRIPLTSRAFATALGSVAGGKIKWCYEPGASEPATISAGSVCTEFGIFFTPESFSDGGSYSAMRTEVTYAGGLGSIVCHVNAKQIVKSSTTRKNSNASRMTVNRRAALELLFVQSNES
jgi:hypothetical protein